MALPLAAQQVPVIETNPSNGLRILLVERHDKPRVAGAWVAHVGSASEHPGITGTAHLFEHMMFKGTATIETVNTILDLDILAQQEKLHDKLLTEEARMRAQILPGNLENLLNPES